MPYSLGRTRWTAFPAPASPLDEIESLLSKLGDLERISARVALERATARDLVALCNWLLVAPEIKKVLTGSSISNLISRILNTIACGIEDFSAVTSDITNTLVDDPPLAITDGGMIRPEQTLSWTKSAPSPPIPRASSPGCRKPSASAPGSQPARPLQLGLRLLHRGHKSYLSQVPKNYLRKQTVLNAERFITPELKDHEARVLHAEERIKQLELELLSALRKRVAAEVGRVLTLSGLLAELDALASLARVAREPGYTRPVVDDSTVLEIEAGRHPVVERLLAHQFIANDAALCANVQANY